MRLGTIACCGASKTGSVPPMKSASSAWAARAWKRCRIPHPRCFPNGERGAVGSAIVPVIEGTRPLLVEVQALTSPTVLPVPRRSANGIDFNRLLMLVAVLTRRVGINLSGQDVIVNVAGGFRVREPAADLAVALAIVSSTRDTPLDSGMAALGEVGLSGELRAVPQTEKRLSELGRLGFTSCLMPASVQENPEFASVQSIRATNLRQAIRSSLASRREEPPIRVTAGVDRCAIRLVYGLLPDQDLIVTPPNKHHPVMVSCPSADAGGVRFDSTPPKIAPSPDIYVPLVGDSNRDPSENGDDIDHCSAVCKAGFGQLQVSLPNTTLTRPPLNSGVATWVSLRPKILVMLTSESTASFLAISHQLPEARCPHVNIASRASSA